MTTHAPEPPPPGTLPVNDVFGPTFQGEGPHSGQWCHFVRLGHCNLACSWCDTPYTWDATRYHIPTQNPPRTPRQILDRLASLGSEHQRPVIISGGEPLMHQRRDAFRELVSSLGTVHIETNGTIPPADSIAAEISHFTVSPKLANNAADPQGRRIKPRALRAFADLAEDGLAIFKFVASDTSDLVEIEEITAAHQIPPWAVWVMPEGTHADRVLAHHRDLADAILAARYNTSTRLHALLWDNEKSR